MMKQTFIKKEEVLRGLKKVSLEKITEGLLEVQTPFRNGAVCYLDMSNGKLVFTDDRECKSCEMEIASVCMFYNRYAYRETYHVQELACSEKEFDSVCLVAVMGEIDYEGILNEYYVSIGLLEMNHQT